jgi:hypothetical protein
MRCTFYPTISYSLRRSAALPGLLLVGNPRVRSGLKQESDRPRFDDAVKDIRLQREAQLRKKSAQSRLERRSDAPDCVKASSEVRPFARPWCLESRPRDRLIEPLYGGGKRVIQATRGSLRLLARGKRTACCKSIVTSSDINLASEDRR